MVRTARRRLDRAVVDRGRRGSDDRRHFDLGDYLRTLVESLQPACSRSGVELALDCSLQIDVDSYPGALGQVLTQLTQNALLHAFDGAKQPGHVRIIAGRRIAAFLERLLGPAARP